MVVVTITRCIAFSSFAVPLQAPAAHSTAMQAAAAPITRPVFFLFVIINALRSMVVVVFSVPPTIPQSGGICLSRNRRFYLMH